MIFNYIKIAWRNILKHKTISMINIFSLSLGIAFAIVVFLFVKYEYSFDRFHRHSESIYRVMNKSTNPKGRRIGAYVPMRLADDLKELYPEIEHAVRVTNTSVIVKSDKDPFLETLGLVEENFFNVFSFPILKGNKNNPLEDIHNVVISKKMAGKYFPGKDPVGRQLEITSRGNKMVFLVSAVFDNRKNESSLVFDFLAPFTIYKERYKGKFMMTSYQANGGETYVQLGNKTSYPQFNRKLEGIDKHLSINTKKGKTIRYFLQPLKDIHMKHYNAYTLTVVSDPIYSYILSGLGLLVLLIACINFLTSALGTAVKRSREVGIRKVVGAGKKQLARQYLGEALLLSTVALAAGILLAKLFLPAFTQLADKEIQFQIDPSFLVAVVLITLVVGVVAGSYPALVLSRVNPVTVLKGTVPVIGKNRFSKTLVVLQFVFSAFLIISTLVMQKQLRFMRHMNIGFDQESVVELAMNSRDEESDHVFRTFKNEIRNHTKILAVSAAATPYGSKWTRLGIKTPGNEELKFYYNRVDINYLKTMDIPIVQGRDFSPEFPTDVKNGVIVNETFVRKFGLKEPLNNWIPGKFNNNPRIIGVAKDFHYASLHEEINPLVLTLGYDAVKAKFSSLSTPGWPPHVDYTVIRIAPGDPRPIIDFLSGKWREVSPGSPIEIKFVSDTLNKLYLSEKNWGKIVNHASLFAILIAALGLFGLSKLAAEKRIKEIGIRKVLGAGTGRLVIFFGKDLLRLVALANIFAWPLAYWVMSRWLENFAYKIRLAPSIFILTGVLTLVIAAVTISYQTIKAALTNPVDTVKYE
ncbi:MAG: FtsX-like permease family protein [bacterium]|nr:FtsX-like permease family protein [bacterium]